MGTSGREVYEREFTLDRSVTRTLEVYGRVLKRQLGGMTRDIAPEPAGSGSGAAGD
jgi:hypothetical protein